MTQFIESLDRQQTMLLPECLDDYVDENSPVRAIDAFTDLLDLAVLGCIRTLRRRKRAWQRALARCFLLLQPARISRPSAYPKSFAETLTRALHRGLQTV